MNLNHTRLPVPPYPHILFSFAGNELHYTAGFGVCQGVFITFLKKFLFLVGKVSFKYDGIKFIGAGGGFFRGFKSPSDRHSIELSA